MIATAVALRLPRVTAARLVTRLLVPRVAPTTKAAHAHERELANLFLREARAAQEAVPLGELTKALEIPGTGGPLHVLEEVLDAFLGDTSGDVAPHVRAAAEKKTLGGVLSSTLADGAKASELCQVIVPPVVSGNWATFKSEVGQVEANIRDGVLQIRESFVIEAARGQGHGLALYQQVLAYAEKEGLVVTSSQAVSVNADRVWMSLQKHGYNVRRVADYEIDSSLDKLWAVKNLRLPDGSVLKVRTGEPVWKTTGKVKSP